jgi:hypothetical protein
VRIPYREDYAMRTNKIANYESILQLLGEPGCPFCRFMKNFQAALLQDPSAKEIHHLCSFHTWGLAATQHAASAAKLFLHLLEKQPEDLVVSACDICVLLRFEEDRRIREFIACLNHKLVVQWMRSQPVLCFEHGAKLQHGTTPVMAATFHSITENYREQLVEELSHLRNEHEPSETRWGVLGHAAEFLVSQRGLRQ